MEEAIEIRTSDGVVDGFVYRADDGRPQPGVIHLVDIRGIRPAHRDMAGRLAAQGYTVLMPNIFYRSGRPPVFELPAGAGEEQRAKRMGELRGPLTVDAVERDVANYVDFLAADLAVAPGPMGVVGYCFAGAMAMRTAAVRAERVAAAASFHGGGLYTDTPESPHLAFPRIRARLYFGHAVQDRSMPEEAIKKFDRALAAWGGRYESEVYEGAHHGWTVPDSPVYNQPQAERAFEKLTGLLASTLR
jgi:carboxymethylenebutenolidase